MNMLLYRILASTLQKEEQEILKIGSKVEC